MKGYISSLTSCLLLVLAVTASANTAIPESLIKAAQAEGQVNSVGMPDTWANWKETWEDLKNQYGLAHQDTDMSSAQEIAVFEAEKENASADIGDVGIAFGPIAKKKGVTLGYKTTTWKDIPDWAKDEDGHWVLGYTGTMAFISNNNLVKKTPKTWKDLLNGTYKVSIGDVGSSATANNAILGCAFALGGNEGNIKPALKLFAELAKQGRLSLSEPSIANLEKGEVEMAIIWDFNALNYRERIERDRFTVTIPQDGSIISGYATIINKYSSRPNAAKLAREYILSDKGQINLARGYARPIRTNVELPADVKEILLDNSQYENVRPVGDFAKWNKTSKKLSRLWQENVLIHLQ